MDLLKQLKQLEKIPDAYEKWATYRQTVTDFIIDQTEDFENIALFGAGRCNDLDLIRLVEKFEKVILIDQEAEAMADALRQYSLEGNCKILCIQKDLIGVEEKHYFTYIDKIEEMIRAEEGEIQTSAICKILDEVKETIRRSPIDLGDKQYKNSVVIGLHSQLNIYWAHIWALYSEAFNCEEPLIYEKIRMMNTVAVKKLNQALFKGTSHHLYVGYERQRVERAGQIEGAIQAENDLEQQEALGNLQIQSEIEALWPLKQGCTYVMRLLCITPK